MNDQLRRRLIAEHLRDARARIATSESDAQRRQAERHVRYWTEQLEQSRTRRVPPEPRGTPAPAA